MKFLIKFLYLIADGVTHMFSTMLVITRFLLLKCIDDYDTNRKLDFVKRIETKAIKGLNMMNKDKQDFDYKTTESTYIEQLKMPYLNYNRNVLANTGKDLIDILILDKELQANFFNGVKIIKPRIENVRHSIANMLNVINDHKFKLSEKKNYTSKNLLGLEINTSSKKILNDEFLKINTALKNVNITLINKVSIHVLLGAIDKYIFEDSNCDDLFICRLKPSIILFNTIEDEFLDVKDIVRFLTELIQQYSRLMSEITHIDLTISELTKLYCSKDMFTSYVLIKNIFIKWYIELNVRKDFFVFMNLGMENIKYLDYMVVYSNNADSVFDVLCKAIKLNTSGSSLKGADNLNIQEITITNEKFSTPKFDSYEIDILDRKFLIKKFYERNITSLPTGLSTAYLNPSIGCTSVGFLSMDHKNDEFNVFLFQSVEDMMNEFLRTDNFMIFKYCEDQALWFIYDFLHILNKLVLFKIKLLDPTLLFAVRRNKRWFFRIDDIGNFRYVTSKSQFEN